MPETTEDNKIIKFKTSTFAIILGAAVSFTFTVTTVYNKFLFQEQQILGVEKELQEFRSSVYRLMNEKDEKTNARVDKITNRNTARINELEKSK